MSADERESGLRRMLNFGHTVGHALEAVTKYKQFRHGEAIGYGMLAALAIGVARGVTPKSLYEEVEALITQLGPLPPVADISAKEVSPPSAATRKSSPARCISSPPRIAARPSS